MKAEDFDLADIHKKITEFSAETPIELFIPLPDGMRKASLLRELIWKISFKKRCRDIAKYIPRSWTTRNKDGSLYRVLLKYPMKLGTIELMSAQALSIKNEYTDTPEETHQVIGVEGALAIKATAIGLLNRKPVATSRYKQDLEEMVLFLETFVSPELWLSLSVTLLEREVLMGFFLATKFIGGMGIAPMTVVTKDQKPHKESKES